jgi:ribonuclease VapC
VIIDSSAIVAAVRRDPEASRVIAAVAAADRVNISAPVWFESCIVLMSRRIGLTTEQVGAVRVRMQLELIPFDEVHADAAQAAWLRYGKGRDRAALNFADCMSYALAQVSGEELLYVGADFALTDVATA